MYEKSECMMITIGLNLIYGEYYLSIYLFPTFYVTTIHKINSNNSSTTQIECARGPLN